MLRNDVIDKAPLSLHVGGKAATAGNVKLVKKNNFKEQEKQHFLHEEAKKNQYLKNNAMA